ncbi:MAG: hypothetical protein ABSA43_01760 [Candidatus Microgenomates bacterium]|jgi:DNA polymerase III delta subunit
MDIFIIHGEYSLKSYGRLQLYLDKAKNKNWEIINIEKDFNQTIRTQSLFGRQNLYLLKNLKLIDNKTISKLTGNLIIYSSDKISDTFIKSLPTAKKIEEFILPKSIFNFLDSFFPGNSAECLSLLHQIVEHEPIEFIFTLLGKTLRDLYWVKISPSDIPYPSWRVDKLERQAFRFSEGLLKEIISDLAEIDIKAKTSQGELLDSLDLLIIKKIK